MTVPYDMPMIAINAMLADLRKREVTPLPKGKEAAFRRWLERNRVRDLDHPQSFYDYRGAFLAGVGRGRGEEGHFPDTFKQHGHPTFSTESRYAFDSEDTGRWDGDTYVPMRPLALTLLKYAGRK